MVTQHLGYSVDLACGGVDNLVRHHDYTIAIVETISGKPFAKYWLHGGHLYVDGKKMSKSKGNILYLYNILSKNYSAEQIRFFLIYGDYRKKLNFTWRTFAETSQKLNQLKALLDKIKKTTYSKSYLT